MAEDIFSWIGDVNQNQNLKKKTIYYWVTLKETQNIYPYSLAEGNEYLKNYRQPPSTPDVMISFLSLPVCLSGEQRVATVMGPNTLEYFITF